LKYCVQAEADGDQWQLYDLAAGKSLRSFKPELNGAIALTNDGEWLVVDTGGRTGRHAINTVTGVDTFQFGDNYAKWVSQQGSVGVMEWQDEAWCVVHANSGRILGVAPRSEAKPNHLVGVSADGRLLVTRSFEGDPNAAAKGRNTGNPNDPKVGGKVTSKLQIWTAD
jgi:hypothetical protein